MSVHEETTMTSRADESEEALYAAYGEGMRGGRTVSHNTATARHVEMMPLNKAP